MIRIPALSTAFLVFFGFSLAKGLWLPQVSATSIWATDVFAFIVLPTLLVLFLSERGVRIATLLSTRPQARNTHGLTLFLGCIVLLSIGVVYPVVLRMARHWVGQGWWPLVNYGAMVPSNGIWRVGALAYLALSAGVVEEFFYRGVVYRLLAPIETTFRKATFVLGSAALFAAIHWATGLANVVATFIVGLMMACWYLHLRTIVPLVLAHAALDIILFAK